MDLITIKGRKEGLSFYFNTSEATCEDLILALEKKFLEGGGFLRNSNYIIEGKDELEPNILEKIVAIFDKNEMSEAQIVPKPIKEVAEMIEKPKQEPVVEVKPIIDLQTATYQAQAGDSVLITHSLRSGQTLEIEGNAIIMGDVNAGANVLATGNIIVMGALKGVVHAGIMGDVNTFVMAYSMQPIQIRIANILSRSDDEDTLKHDFPEVAKIVDNNIQISLYDGSKRLQNKKLVV